MKESVQSMFELLLCIALDIPTLFFLTRQSKHCQLNRPLAFLYIVIMYRCSTHHPAREKQALPGP